MRDRITGLEAQLLAERERADKNADVIEATALELHDEREKVQTLVDALKRLREFRRMNITPVEDIAADALAKVKEGKV